MSNEIHEYFIRKATEWNIIDFLEECSEDDFQKKIDKYLKSLDTIVNLEQGKRKTKAEFLLRRYRESSPNLRASKKIFVKNVNLKNSVMARIRCGSCCSRLFAKYTKPCWSMYNPAWLSNV